MSNSLFGVDATKLSDPQGQGANVVNPVTANPLAGIADGIGNVVSIFAKAAEKDRKQQDQAILGEYSTKLNAIANGVSSGQLDPKEAYAKASQLYQDFSGTRAPHLAEELAKTRKAIFEGSSLSEAEDAVKRERELRFEAVKSFQAAGGYVSPNASQADINIIIKADAVRKTEDAKWQRFRQEQEEFRNSKRYDAEVAKREEERLANDSLNSLASSQLPAFNMSMENILKDMDAGKVDWKTASSIQNAQYGALKLRLSQVAGMSPQLAEHWGKILDESNAVYKRLLNPETRSSVSKSELEEIQNKAKLMVWMNSPSARASLLNNYFAPGTVATLNSGTTTVAEIASLLAGSKPESGENIPPVIGDKQNSKPVISTLMSNMKNVYGMTDGDPKKTLAVEGMKNSVNNLLIDIYKAGSNEFKPLTPADLNDASVLISSPEFGRMVKEGLVSNKAIGAAQRILAIQYNQPVLNKVSETLSSIQSNLKDVDVKYQDGQVVVVGKTDTTRSGIQQDSSRQQGVELSKAIDRVVKMNAHLEGRTDYDQYWLENRHLLVPTLYQTPGLKVGTQKQGKDGSTYEYTGGPELNKSSWTKVK